MFVRLASSDLTDEQRISTPTGVIRFELRKYQAGHGSPSPEKLIRPRRIKSRGIPGP
jgi:hypothetical protein